MKNSTKLSLLLSVSLTLGLGGCLTTSKTLKKEVADRIASPAWMIERQIPAAPFALTAFERMHKRHAPADIYIEGDGIIQWDPERASLDPTPENPVALHMAAYDKADNVPYLARPCQFSGMLDSEQKCDKSYWTDKRFSAEIINSYQKALDEIKTRYNITEFNLIGFSGGGAIATLLAAQRKDVVSLRTVAGLLDHQAYSSYQKTPALTGSLNPIDYASHLKNIPQVHFIGGQDDTAPPAVLHSYLQALGESQCVKYQFIQESEHETGWVDKWPELLQKAPECRGPVIDFENIDLSLDLPEPIYETPMRPSKP